MCVATTSFSYRCWDVNAGRLVTQQVLLPTEPSLQPQLFSLVIYFYTICTRVGYMYECSCQNWMSDPLDLKFQTAVNCLSRCWELNPGHLQEQYTILTAEPCGFWGLNSGPLRTSSPALLSILNKDVLGQTPNKT